MRRLSLGLAAAATLLSAGTARADLFTSCGTVSGFTQCASATVTQLNPSTVTVMVQNLGAGADSYRLTGFGFYYAGVPLGSTSTLQAMTGWSDGTPVDLQNPGPGGTVNWILGAEATPPNPINTIDSGEAPVTFTFTIAPGTTIDQTELTFAFRAQSIGPDEALSNKIYTSTVSTVPEPATVLLLAGGLLGLGGVGVVRRRQGAAA